jgi:hypothetical protein
MPVYNAIANDDYSRGRSDITVSQLSKPPRAVALEKRHWGELKDDASDRIWLLLGKAIHYILEKNSGSGDIAELRLYTEIGGWVVGGQFDSFNVESGVLSDYKVCSVWQAIKHYRGESSEWVEQLNAYAHLLRAHGHEVKKLQIVAILRDWSKPESLRNEYYPASQVQAIEIEMWPDKEIDRWLRERVAAHQLARKQLPECSPEERWQKPDIWAIKKKGRKSAVRVLYDKESADKLLDELGKDHSIEFRKGLSVRCSYCLIGKNGLCEQYEAIKKESDNDEGTESEV